MRRSDGPLRKDALKALILERQNALHKTDRQMAGLLGLSRNTWSCMIKQRHTDEWELGQLITICIRLGITAEEFKDRLIYRIHQGG